MIFIHSGKLVERGVVVPGGELPDPPPGKKYMIDNDGKYLLDDDGKYLLGDEEE